MKNIIKEIKKSIKIKKIADLFRMDITKNINTFHSNYLFVFLIEFILFFFLSIFLYKSSKYYNKNIENNLISIPRGVKEKYELSNFLSKAVLFRCFTFLYFILFSNQTGYDFISFINYLLHIFPSFMFLMSLYLNIGFLIEKFYAIAQRRIYILTSLKYVLYFSLLLIILLSFSIFIFRIYQESYFFIESLMCLNFLIIGFLYMIYGRKISNLMQEANNNRLNNPLSIKHIRNNIHFKIIGTCFIVCPSYIIVGAIKGLVALDFFDTWYPNFMDLNLYDCIVFFFCEFLPSFIIGRTDVKWNNFKIEELNRQVLLDDIGPLINQDERSELLEKKTLEEQIKEKYTIFEEEKF